MNEKKLNILINKAIKKGDLVTIKEIYKTNESKLQNTLSKKFRFACETSTKPVLVFLFNEWKTTIKPNSRFDSEIENALIFLIKKNNDFFFDIIDEFTDNKYQEAKHRLFNISVSYGNIAVIEYYLQDRDIDPSENKNSTLLILLRKIETSPNKNKLKKILNILNQDERVIAMAVKLDQYELLPDTAKDMFLF